jgi:hypothetical protein
LTWSLPETQQQQAYQSNASPPLGAGLKEQMEREEEDGEIKSCGRDGLSDVEA